MRVQMRENLLSLPGLKKATWHDRLIIMMILSTLKIINAMLLLIVVESYLTGAVSNQSN